MVGSPSCSNSTPSSIGSRSNAATAAAAAGGVGSMPMASQKPATGSTAIAP